MQGGGLAPAVRPRPLKMTVHRVSGQASRPRMLLQGRRELGGAASAQPHPAVKSPAGWSRPEVREPERAPGGVRGWRPGKRVEVWFSRRRARLAASCRAATRSGKPFAGGVWGIARGPYSNLPADRRGVRRQLKGGVDGGLGVDDDRRPKAERSNSPFVQEARPRRGQGAGARIRG